jgi:hypothetical protein
VYESLSLISELATESISPVFGASAFDAFLSLDAFSGRVGILSANCEEQSKLKVSAVKSGFWNVSVRDMEFLPLEPELNTANAFTLNLTNVV